jgi:hypothetical protein
MREPGWLAGLLFCCWFYYIKLTITENRFLEIFVGLFSGVYGDFWGWGA